MLTLHNLRDLLFIKFKQKNFKIKITLDATFESEYFERYNDHHIVRLYKIIRVMMLPITYANMVGLETIPLK